MSEVIRGSFTIDRARAREKLSRYQLSDPYAYVLELVQAAVLRGATKIDFKLDTDDMRMSFDGRPFTTEELSNLELAVLDGAETDEQKARRQLAVGILSAQSLKPKLVIMDSKGGGRLEQRAGRAETLTDSRRVKRGTLIHVRDRWHPRLLLEIWKELRGRGKEAVLLRERCASACIPITVNRKLISQNKGGLEEGTRCGEVSIEKRRCHGWGGFVSGAPAELLLYSHGVRIETMALDMGAMPFRAIIHCDKLKKDLSGGAVLRDEMFERVLTAVRAARQRAIVQYCREDARIYVPSVREELLSAPSLEALSESKGYPGCLTGQMVWELANGETCSFDAFIEARKTLGFLPYSVESFNNETLEDMPIVWRRDDELWPALRTLMGNAVKNVTRRLRNQVASKANRQRWLSRPAEPVLQGKKLLARRKLDGPGLEGEMGVYRYQSTALLRLLKDGCLLCEVSLEKWPKGLEVVLAADFEPLKNYEGVQVNEIFVRALLTAIQGLPPLYEAAAAGSRQRFRKTKKETLAVLADFLRVASQSDPIGFLLEDCGAHAAQFPKLVKDFPWPAPDLESESALVDIPWVETDSGRRLSLRDLHPASRPRDSLVLAQSQRGTLKRLLGERFELQEVAPAAKVSAPSSVINFSVDPRWLKEEFFLAALRRELKHLQKGQNLLGDINLSRMVVSDAGSRAAITIRPSGVVALHRRHELVSSALADYQDEPTVLLLLVSVLYSTLNRVLSKVSDQDELKMQEQLLEYAMEGSSRSRYQSQGEEQVSGFLEPICSSGYCTGWAQDPGGLGLRFYLTAPSLEAEPMTILSLDSPREEGGHHFLFELPQKYLDGQKVKLWAGVVDPKLGTLVELTGSPRTFAAAKTEPTMPIGYMDRISDSGVCEGWCLDPNEPEVALKVDFHLDGSWKDGEFIGRAVADLPREDVNEGTGYPGHHGFRFQIPAEHVDGCRHTVCGYALDSEGKLGNPLLKGCPMSFGGN